MLFALFRTSKDCRVDVSEAVEDEAELFLAKTIQSVEEKMNEAGAHENVVEDAPDVEDNVGSGNANDAL